MSKRALIFISILTGIIGLGTFYIGLRWITQLSWHSPWAAQHTEAIWLALAIYVVIQVSGPILYNVLDDSHWLFIVHWIAFTGLGVFACMFLYTVAGDFIVGLWKLIFTVSDPGLLEHQGFFVTGILILITLIFGAMQAAKGPKIYNVEVPIKNLPKEFDGFKIAQISDLHIGPMIGPRYTKRVVKMVNKLSPNLVALTGDIIDGSVDQAQRGAAPLAHFESTHGTFYITGNHEYYWGVDVAIGAIRKIGARTLLNEHVVLEKGQDKMVLAGVTDYSAGHMVHDHHSDPKKALEGAPENLVKILLAHQPASYKAASAAGSDLQLSGHTHGGQFFPWSLVVALAQRYYKGLNRHENMWVYVNRGTAFWGPPLRFGIPSEITLLKLKSF
jgi:predicted MPP superfamily phosphohydrolase